MHGTQPVFLQSDEQLYQSICDCLNWDDAEGLEGVIKELRSRRPATGKTPGDLALDAIRELRAVLHDLVEAVKLEKAWELFTRHGGQSPNLKSHSRYAEWKAKRGPACTFTDWLLNESLSAAETAVKGPVG